MAAMFARTTPPASHSCQEMVLQKAARSKKVVIYITSHRYQYSLQTASVSQVIPDSSVRTTLMTVNQIPVKMMPTALTVLLVFHARVKLDLPVQHVEPISMIALLVYAKTMVLARTLSMALYATALWGTQGIHVEKTSTNVRLLRWPV
jgi:hypothetical protein